VVHFARFAGFDDQPGLHPQALADEVVVDGRRRQQRRHRDPVRPLRAVGQDQDVLVLQHRFGRGPAHFLDRHFKAAAPLRGIPGDVDRFGAERAVERGFDRADLGNFIVGQDRLVDFEPLVRAGIHAQQVGARADHRHQAHHQFLADRIDRRVGDLREVLLEIIVEQRGCGSTARRSAYRCPSIRSDRRHWRHRLEEPRDVFLRIAEGLLAIEQAGGFDRQLRQFGSTRSRSLSLYCAASSQSS
jgi:hypothetical protein